MKEDIEDKEDIKYILGFPHVPYHRPLIPHEELDYKSKTFCDFMLDRRSVRTFSDRPVPRDVIENIIMTASSAPSGAHKQPWTFCIISDPALKKDIRLAAEEEEYASYHGRMSDEWLQDLAPLGTDWQKPFLEIAPYLIVVFRRSYEWDAQGHKHQNYYVTESVGIACGLLIAAIHHAGLAALTHTPSPMNFLTKILQRPDNEKPFLLIPVGYAAEECWVPDLQRKPLAEVAVWY